MIHYLKPDKELGNVIPNIARMLEKNVIRFPNKIVYAEKINDKYNCISWVSFIDGVRNIATNLKTFGFEKGDKMMVYSPNRLEMLQLEMAVMAGGGVSVPIFAYFQKETVDLLVKHSDTKFIAVAGELQLNRLSKNIAVEKIFVFDNIQNSTHKNLIPFHELVKNPKGEKIALDFEAKPDDICLNMYTSGSTGIPKCVQLTHQNILSQQAGLENIWDLNENDRFLSYLPWHHSFGGIFERFSALYNGAAIYLESGYGKEPKKILENWKTVQPTLFFSVPLVYKLLIELCKSDKELEKTFFHPELKFIFTAAASLPKNISDEFENRGIPVMEGWGLTETSPCCTITDPKMKRETGIVGKPIPGVEIRIVDDGEIKVKGPNVMKGYYKNDEANSTACTNDGWYCTGDIGEISLTGLKLISRKDRIFKLTNGEKVIPTEMENLIQMKCHYVAYAMVVGGAKEYPVALLFPNKKVFDHPDYEISPEEGCFCPRSITELGKCLHGCLHDANCGLNQKFSKIKYAMIIDDELSIEKNTLTPSMKIIPSNVQNIYKAQIENLYGAKNKASEEVYVIKLDTDNSVTVRELQDNVGQPQINNEITKTH